MKKRKGDDWIPLWVDKWLFGSTRHELLPDEQSVWIDFLVLAAKDEGHIRANETMPYPIDQLAGMLKKDKELIQRTVDKCSKSSNAIDTPKLTITQYGTLYITNYEEYQLSKRQKFRLMAQNSDVASPEGDPSNLISSTLISSNLLKKGVVKGETNEAQPQHDSNTTPAQNADKPPKPENDYNASDLIAYFGTIFKRVVGDPYPANFGKEGKIFKDLLQQYPALQILDIIDKFFEESQVDGSWTKDKLTIGILKTQWVKLLIKVREERKNYAKP